MNKQTHDISDLGLAALLRYSGYPPKSIISSNGKIIFQYENSNTISTLIDMFERGVSIEMDVKRYLSIFKDTKHIVFCRSRS